MPDVMSLYADDSGTRNPDRNPKDKLPAHGYDWFGLGGVLIREADEPRLRAMHSDLCRRWNIDYPLHSSEIRARAENFRWLGQVSQERRTAFYEDIKQLVTAPEITATACVIDRPGYNNRYKEKYGCNRWSLCKTAFNILVERCAKYARSEGCRLRILFEASDKKTDRRLKQYYKGLLADGLPFDKARSSRYEPLNVDNLRSVLYGFKTKEKQSPLMQLADLCLWPICIGGYEPACKPYC
ncbi:MAG: DUF3800 domain-containing protein, partial [Myxococcota bacterium]